MSNAICHGISNDRFNAISPPSFKHCLEQFRLEWDPQNMKRHVFVVEKDMFFKKQRKVLARSAPNLVRVACFRRKKGPYKNCPKPSAEWGIKLESRFCVLAACITYTTMEA